MLNWIYYVKLNILYIMYVKLIETFIIIIV